MRKISLGQIKKISQRIVEEYKPEKIILFGSYAWGEPTEDSDVDLFIVKKTRQGFVQRHLKARKAIGGEVAADVLVRTPKEAQERLEIGDFFIKNPFKNCIKIACFSSGCQGESPNTNRY